MSRRRPSAQPTALLYHPQDPSITVTVRKPTRIEAMRYGEKLALRQRATLVYDKDNQPVYDSNGVPLTHLQQLMPVDLVIEGLRVAVVRWSGVVDGDDRPIAFSEENLHTLFEEWLDCEMEVDRAVFKDGKVQYDAENKVVTEKKKITVPFGRWISIQVSKTETFDSDPKTNGSAAQ